MGGSRLIESTLAVGGSVARRSILGEDLLQSSRPCQMSSRFALWRRGFDPERILEQENLRLPGAGGTDHEGCLGRMISLESFLPITKIGLLQRDGFSTRNIFFQRRSVRSLRLQAGRKCIVRIYTLFS